MLRFRLPRTGRFLQSKEGKKLSVPCKESYTLTDKAFIASLVVVNPYTSLNVILARKLDNSVSLALHGNPKLLCSYLSSMTSQLGKEFVMTMARQGGLSTG